MTNLLLLAANKCCHVGLQIEANSKCKGGVSIEHCKFPHCSCYNVPEVANVGTCPCGVSFHACAAIANCRNKTAGKAKATAITFEGESILLKMDLPTAMFCTKDSSKQCLNPQGCTLAGGGGCVR